MSVTRATYWDTCWHTVSQKMELNGSLWWRLLNYSLSQFSFCIGKKGFFFCFYFKKFIVHIYFGGREPSGQLNFWIVTECEIIHTFLCNIEFLWGNQFITMRMTSGPHSDSFLCLRSLLRLASRWGAHIKLCEYCNSYIFSSVIMLSCLVMIPTS